MASNNIATSAFEASQESNGIWGPVDLFGDDPIEKSAKTRKNCICLLYTSPSPRDRTRSRMPSSA